MIGPLKIAFVLPAFVSGLWFVKTSSTASVVNYADPNLQVSQAATDHKKLEATTTIDKKKLKSIEQEVVARRVRIERVLFTLERVAQVASQMNPERVASLEPVLTDLTTQTMELTSVDNVLDQGTDAELDKLETTVHDLVMAMDKVVEPEISL